MGLKKSVRIVEVGVRDGLQNEKTILPVRRRLELAQRLVFSGVRHLELGAFVSPKWVPAMQGADELFQNVQLLKQKGELNKKVIFSALVPNERGFEDALKAGAKEIALFAAASNSFSLKNINCTIEESFIRYGEIAKLAKKNKIKIRGYVSTSFGCPFEGKVQIKAVLKGVERFFKMGCYEVSLGDTIGVAHPKAVEFTLNQVAKEFSLKEIAGHFHDTRGTALANIFMAYEMGVRVFDASIGGLGGCPYAPSATGNVATEDVVFLFDQMGVQSGISLERLLEVNRWLSALMGKHLPSKVGQAGGALKPLGKVQGPKSK